jgi:hypothetical protein
MTYEKCHLANEYYLHMTARKVKKADIEEFLWYGVVTGPNVETFWLKPKRLFKTQAELIAAFEPLKQYLLTLTPN